MSDHETQVIEQVVKQTGIGLEVLYSEDAPHAPLSATVSIYKEDGSTFLSHPINLDIALAIVDDSDILNKLSVMPIITPPHTTVDHICLSVGKKDEVVPVWVGEAVCSFLGIEAIPYVPKSDDGEKE